MAVGRESGMTELTYLIGLDGGGSGTRVRLLDATGQLLLQTSVSGQLEPLTPQSVRRALWQYPAMTVGVVLRIHWQALRLWVKRVPFFRKPEPPQQAVSRSA